MNQLHHGLPLAEVACECIGNAVVSSVRGSVTHPPTNGTASFTSPLPIPASYLIHSQVHELMAMRLSASRCASAKQTVVKLHVSCQEDQHGAMPAGRGSRPKAALSLLP